jgi:hypothetical protein
MMKRLRARILVLAVMLIVYGGVCQRVLAQNVITNVEQLGELIDEKDWQYFPTTPWQWEIHQTDPGPSWADLSQTPWTELLQTLTNATQPSPLFPSEACGVKLVAARVTCSLLTGEVVLESEWTGKEVARLAPPADYQPETSGQPYASVWSMWEQWLKQWTNTVASLDEWYGTLEPPTLVLHLRLADTLDKPIYDQNLAAAEEAAAAVSSRSRVAAGGGMMGPMDDPGGAPCTITNDASAFYVISEVSTSNAWVTTTWQSCTDHVYIVQAESS